MRCASWALLGLSACAEVLVPYKLDIGELEHLADQQGLQTEFKQTLSTHGILQVSGIPGFSALRQQVLREAYACISEAPHAQTLTFDDGTVRRTLAAASGVTFGLQGVDHGTDADVCRDFEETSSSFRELVGKTADAFARQLGHSMDTADQGHLLSRKDGGSYGTLEEAVRSGERLHHFHSYELFGTTRADEPTMDFHVDQGFFIAFVPAMMVGEDFESSSSTGKFVVKNQDGQESDVLFDSDSLVFVLGDAMNQVLNRFRGAVSLHAPSHAMQMPEDSRGLHRVWYGMMQLPPVDAVVPDIGFTFGELRENVIKASDSSDSESESALSLGCSRKLQARELSGQCNDTQIYCWHRCYDFTAELSPTACAANNLGFNCTSQFDQVYIGGHGDFNPSCTNTTETVTPRPSVVQPTGACSEWNSELTDSNYTHRAALVEGETHLLWNVVGDKLEVKMIHKGLVGWMAVGIQNIGGHHKGMNGGSVVMGRNIPGSSPTVGEYRIHDSQSAFRHWKTPLSPSALTATSMTSSGCVSSLVFKTDSIHGVPLNLTDGTTNRMIFALTQLDYPTNDFGGYSGYHASPTSDRDQRTRFRGHSHLDFAGGRAIAETVPTEDLDTSGALLSTLAAMPPVLLASLASLYACIQ